MFCVCSGMIACCVAGDAGVSVPVRPWLDAELRAGYLSLVMEGFYHDDSKQGIFLEIGRLNGIPVQELCLSLAVRCVGVQGGEEVVVLFVEGECCRMYCKRRMRRIFFHGLRMGPGCSRINGRMHCAGIMPGCVCQSCRVLMSKSRHGVFHCRGFDI